MGLKLLRAGISGFSNSAVNQEITDKTILADCHLVARELGWNVGKKVWAGATGSYHSVQFVSREGSIWILFNLYYPICAFTERVFPGLGELRFAEHSELTDAVSRVTNWVCVNAENLERAPCADDFDALEQDELQQIKYWRPSRIGDIIFNHWD